MKTRALAFAFVILAVLAVAGLRPAAAAPSSALSNVLWTLRTIGDEDFSHVVYWARNGAGWPSSSSTAYQRAERNVLNLDSGDRDAVLSWLRGNSRSALYARGATDSDIGSRRPVNMSGTAPTPTPLPYRQVTFSSTGIGSTQGHITVLGGFAAFKRDGTAAVICLSFRNISAKTASRVVFDFVLYGPRNGTLGDMQLDRRGEFSPNVDINGWSDLSSWTSGVGHRGYGDNCRYVTQGTASQPFLNAAGVTYRVTRVEYNNGSVWPNF